jgi:hypothetical protein
MSRCRCPACRCTRPMVIGNLCKACALGRHKPGVGP